jgi:cytochrome c553
MGEGVPPKQRTPGGDFGWLKKTYSWVPRSGAATEYSYGERHGHNIIAPDHGYVADSRINTSPGGNYPANKLHCSSCHDPHGKYRRNANGSITTSGLPIRGSGSYNNSLDPVDNTFAVGVYRLLAGQGYAPKSYNGVTFTYDPPAAVAPSTYNKSETSNTTQARVAYGMGMSEWCANCHGRMHLDSYTSGQDGLVHPAGNGAKLTADIVNNYIQYVKTGDMSGTLDTSYNTLVPFEIGVTDHSVTSYATLKSLAQANTTSGVGLKGPDTNSNVMCLSCHRAHASGWDSMLRYNLGYEFMVGADNSNNPVYYGTDSTIVNNAAAMGRTVAEHQAAYYDRPASMFAAYQRALCNKCHAKD